ncbi:unnamed protein product [Enterobius vermicularis]|uniref:MBD domain-containing protein n=1 Tax=Enterobius vermicularis TaxID=51028 RepID=A0A0N4V1V4_ENTVE|nr:unnamed protein product [Enterobius vermicularis]
MTAEYIPDFSKLIPCHSSGRQRIMAGRVVLPTESPLSGVIAALPETSSDYELLAEEGLANEHLSERQQLLLKRSIMRQIQREVRESRPDFNIVTDTPPDIDLFLSLPDPDDIGCSNSSTICDPRLSQVGYGGLSDDCTKNKPNFSEVSTETASEAQKKSDNNKNKLIKDVFPKSMNSAKPGVSRVTAGSKTATHPRSSPSPVRRCRRSQRNRIHRLRWWLGERPIYRKDAEGNFELVGVTEAKFTDPFLENYVVTTTMKEVAETTRQRRKIL